MSNTLEDILSSLSLQELLAAREKIDERIVRVQRAEHNAARKKILELARLHGIDVSFAESEEPSKKSKLPPKYRHPANQKQTWPGHGKKPAWLEDLLAKGHKLEEFFIKD